MTLQDKTTPLITSRSFDEIESLWMSQLESDPMNVEDFLNVAKALRKSDERPRADALLELLADTLKERGAWPQRLRVLRELARLSKKPQTFRPTLEEALKNTFGSRPSFKRAFAASGFSDPAANPGEKAEKIETWMQYEEGEKFFMSGRGAGIVTELNPELGVCRLDFEKDKRISVPLGAAQKFLIPLPPGHVLRERLENPEAFREQALKKPPEIFSRILQSFGRPMAVGEVKDAMIGIVPDEKWSSWWTSARKHPQIVVAGSGAKATYSWKESTGHADDSIRRDFDNAKSRDKLDLARKHSARSKDLADYFAQQLAREAEKISNNDPALAWEIFATLDKLPGTHASTFNPDMLLSGPLASRVLSSISDRLLRERALKAVRERHPEWQKIFAETFFREEDPRVLSSIMATLEAEQELDVRDRLIDETLRYPSRHPKAFYWYCKRLNDSEMMPEKGAYSLLHQMIDAAGSEEYGPLRARFKDFFDKGGLAVRIVMKSDQEEEARKLVDNLERYGQIEEYRRDNLRTAALMKYPHLREPQVEPVYATAEALTKKRAELEHLLKVEIPANSKAIQVAREMGDLRENFEYKAARQRAEYLAARSAALSNEISRVRIIEPEQVDISEVRIGTRVALRNGDVRREVTILGPWESDPERGVYSNQSEAAHALLGHHTGDVVTFMGNDYEIEAINKWA